MKCRQAQLLTVSAFQCRHLRRAEPARALGFSICQHLANASLKAIIHHQPQGTEVYCASDQLTTEPPHASYRTRAPSRLGGTAARSTDPVAPWHLHRMRREASRCSGTTSGSVMYKSYGISTRPFSRTFPQHRLYYQSHRTTTQALLSGNSKSTGLLHCSEHFGHLNAARYEIWFGSCFQATSSMTTNILSIPSRKTDRSIRARPCG